MSDQNQKDKVVIHSDVRKIIEKLVLKILYEKKSVKTLKLLIDKVLQGAVKSRITISEKIINKIIQQMNKDNRIQFTQKEGWKIKI